jgi:hypothetical protein
LTWNWSVGKTERYWIFTLWRYISHRGHVTLYQPQRSCSTTARWEKSGKINFSAPFTVLLLHLPGEEKQSIKSVTQITNNLWVPSE